MYVCGPTVYDYAHIGNARPVIVFDVLFRLLRHIYGRGSRHLCAQHHRRRRQDQRARGGGYPEPAAERGDPQLTERDRPAVPRRHRGARRAGADRRAARHRAHRRDDGVLIEALVAAATPTWPRSTCCSTCRRCRTTARLSNRSLEEMEAGARVDVAPYKKRADGLRAVEAVQGGRAVLAVTVRHRDARPARLAHRVLGHGGEHLGQMFDIHGGGIDLVFPHHENEIAQIALRARHAGDGQRVDAQRLPAGRGREDVASRLGNFVTIHELLATRSSAASPGMGASSGSRCSARTIASRSIGRWSGWCRRARTADGFRPSFLHEAPSRRRAASRRSLQRFPTTSIRRSAMPIIHRLAKSAHRNAASRGAVEGDTAVSWGLRERDARGFRSRLRGLECGRRHGGRPDRRPQRRPQGQGLQGEPIASATSSSAMGIQLKDAKDPRTGEIVTTWEVKR